MNPTMMRMIVKAEQDEKIRRVERPRVINSQQAYNHSGSLKKLALGLVAFGAMTLLIAWAMITV